MKKLIISYDKTAKLYGGIIEVDNIAAFKREIANVVISAKGMSNLERFPQDFDFLEVGSYDNSTGEIKLLDANAFLFNAGEFVKVNSGVENGETEENK